MTERRQQFLNLMLEDPYRSLKGAAELAGFADPRRQGSRLMSVPEIRTPVDAERKRRSDAFRAKCKAQMMKRVEVEYIVQDTLPLWARKRRRRRRCM